MPIRRESSNVKLALRDRLLLSEAIDAVGRMIRGYANSGQAGRSYIGAIAELLLQYPRGVALRCADPFRGVARDTKFMPTPADVIGFCEKACAPMYEEAAREDRVADQLRARVEWEKVEKDPVLLAKVDAWLDRTDPVARALTGGADGDEAARRARSLESIADAGRRVFLRECAQEGIDPGRGVSPALLKTLGGPAPARREEAVS